MRPMSLCKFVPDLHPWVAITFAKCDHLTIQGGTKLSMRDQILVKLKCGVLIQNQVNVSLVMGILSFKKFFPFSATIEHQ